MSSQQPFQQLRVTNVDNVTVINFTDKRIVQEQHIQMILEELLRVVDELGRRKLLLSFSNVEWLSSAALGRLITLNKKINALDGRLILCDISPQIYEVFQVTKFNKFFEICGKEADGLAALGIRPSEPD